MRTFVLALDVATGLDSSSTVADDVVFEAPVAAANCDPYPNCSCLDSYLGDDFLTRLYRY
jgi:hypothetical protein